jgi:hypothetical protein
MIPFQPDYTAPDYNAYATVAEIDDLMAYYDTIEGENVGWGNLDTTAKEHHIVNASERMGDVAFAGTLSPDVITTRPMHWPRTGVKYPNGQPVPDNEVPQEIKAATACIIRAALRGEYRSGNAALGMVKKKKVDDIEIEFETGNTGAVLEEDPTDTCVSDTIPKGWITETGADLGMGSIPLRRRL